jgi:ribonuclease PH
MKSHDGHHDVIISHTGVLRHLVTSVLARSNFACVFFLLVSPARETEAEVQGRKLARCLCSFVSTPFSTFALHITERISSARAREINRVLERE